MKTDYVWDQGYLPNYVSNWFPLDLSKKKKKDSLLTVKWLDNYHMNFPLELRSLILDCRSLLDRTWTVHLRHVWREANFCENRLASRSVVKPEREILYDTCPIFFVRLPLLGLYGLFFNPNITVKYVYLFIVLCVYVWFWLVDCLFVAL